MCLLLPRRHAARLFVCKEASDCQRASVARRRSEAGIMSHRTPLLDPHHKHLWAPLPVGRRASGACRRALPAKATGHGNGGPRRLQGVHCWSVRQDNQVFLYCSALLYRHAFCAALPPAASAAPCVELCKRHHCTVVLRHRGPAHMWQLAGTCLATDTPAGTLQQRCSCTPDVDAHIYVSQPRLRFPRCTCLQMSRTGFAKPPANVCAGVTVMKAFRADPSKSIVDHLLEVSKVAEGLRAQDIDKLRESERSLQHYADDLRVHTLYTRATSAKNREHARRDGKRKLEGMFCACCANGLLQCASAMCVNDEVCCCQDPEH